MQEKKNGREDADPVDEEKRALLRFCRKLFGTDGFENEVFLIEGIYDDDFLRLTIMMDWDAVPRSDAKDEIGTVHKYFPHLSKVLKDQGRGQDGEPQS